METADQLFYLPDLARAFVAVASSTARPAFCVQHFAGHTLTGAQLLAAVEPVPLQVRRGVGSGLYGPDAAPVGPDLASRAGGKGTLVRRCNATRAFRVVRLVAVAGGSTTFLVLPVAALLDTLKRDLNLTLPDPVPGWLEKAPASVCERLEARYRVAGFPRQLLGEQPILYFAYPHQRFATGSESAAGFAAWLRDYWQKDNTAALAMPSPPPSRGRVRERGKNLCITTLSSLGWDSQG